MYNYVHMTQISVSQFRQNLPSFINRVFAGEEFLVIKNKIPVATVTPVKKEKIFKKKIDLSTFGIWKNRKDFKGMSTVQIADSLRDKAWKGNYAD